MSNPVRSQLQSERGITLIEILVMIVISSGVLLSLAASMGFAYKNLSHSRMDMDAYAAMQTQLESLINLPYDSVTAGSSTVNGYSLTWFVEGLNPKALVLDLHYTNRSGYAMTERSVIYYPPVDST